MNSDKKAGAMMENTPVNEIVSQAKRKLHKIREDAAREQLRLEGYTEAEISLAFAAEAVPGVPTTPPMQQILKKMEPPKVLPLPKLDIGSTAPARIVPGIYADADGLKPPQDIRVNVTHKAHSEWITLFGAEDGQGNEVSQTDLRRRIIAFYFQGKLENHGGEVYTAWGVEKYSLRAAALRCLLRDGVMYISSVEECALQEI